MAEYIEKEALMRRIKEIHCAECDNYHGVRCRACWVDDTLDYIDSETAADVTQVRHGWWIKYQIPPIICCSNCDWATDVEEKNFQYCPNCGAKMDGGAEDASV